MNASSTFAAVLAEVSMKIRPCSRANASPSSFLTSRLASRSLKRDQRGNLREVIPPGSNTAHAKRSLPSRGLSAKGQAPLCPPLISNKHDNHIRIGMLSGIFQPGCQMVERVTPITGGLYEPYLTSYP